MYLQAYYDEHKDLRVPFRYVTADGFSLGMLVNSIRSQGAYVNDHPERMEWLQERGWIANVSGAQWEDARMYLQAYYDEHKDLSVPFKYVTADGFPLGRLVCHIRSRGDYVNDHPERMEWLQERGWIANVSDAQWEDARIHIQAYYDKHQDLRVPQRYVTTDGFSLGLLVNHIRAQGAYVKEHPERLEWLHERGFKMHTRDPIKDAGRWVKFGMVARATVTATATAR